MTTWVIGANGQIAKRFCEVAHALLHVVQTSSISNKEYLLLGNERLMAMSLASDDA